MSDPRPPAKPPVVKDAATGEWSAQTAREIPVMPDTPTVTASGQAQAYGDLGIPNPFGRYAITHMLGRGGMGAVFLAHDTQLDRPIALKIPTITGVPTAAQKERFFREARAVSALRHPNICPVHDVGEEQGILYLTTSFIDGQPLAVHLERGPMSPEKAVELVRKVAQAMQAAHAHGTVHRDLKPANIMIDRNGEPVVMDFGLARRTAWSEDSREPSSPETVPQGLTQLGSVLGTPTYMPPEQARGDVAAIGPQSDVYSLGVILFELLTGRRPFIADDTSELINKIVNDAPPRISQFCPWIDPKVEAACMKALAKSPTDRFASMAEFDRALKEAVEPELKVVLPPPLPPKTQKTKSAKKRRWATPLTCLLVTASLLTVCVVGPTAAVWWLISATTDKIKEFKEAAEVAEVEWKTINGGFWQPPQADATVNTLFPVHIHTTQTNYHRSRTDNEIADAELGITLPGQRAIYSGEDGSEVEVRAYRCTEEEAKKILANAHAFVNAVKDGTAARMDGSQRDKVVYSANHEVQRSVTFGFTDSLNQNHDYGKLWHGHGWLFYFRTSTPLLIEFFPSKYLMEIGKPATAKPPEKKENKPLRKGK